MKYLILIAFLIGVVFPVFSDSWREPRVIEYYSSDSTYYVKIIPRTVPEKYDKWLNAPARKKKKFTAQDTTVVPCHAKMFRKSHTGDSLIWEQKLINRIAPVTAIVSDDGKYLITFDEWFSLGYGVDVMVVYDERGMLLKRYALEDISPFPINTYKMSISSIWWRCGQKFIDNQNLEICFVNENNEKVSAIYDLKELKIKNVP
jgi:hypothetical protein